MKKSEFKIHQHCGTCKKHLDLHDKGYFGSMCLGHFVPFEDDTPEEIQECIEWDKIRLGRDERIMRLNKHVSQGLHI